MATTETARTSVGAQTSSFGEFFKVWLKIGCINFGGPAGQIAMMHRIVVDEKKWVEEQKAALKQAAAPGDDQRLGGQYPASLRDGDQAGTDHPGGVLGADAEHPEHGEHRCRDALEKGTWLFVSILGALCVVSVMFLSGSAGGATNNSLQDINTSTVPTQQAPNNTQQQNAQPLNLGDTQK
jgi:hypothetical protein